MRGEGEGGGLLFKLQILLPVWIFSIHDFHEPPDHWVSKESKTNQKCSGFGENIARHY